MSKTKLKIHFNYSTSPTNTYKKTTSIMREEAPAKELIPSKPEAQQTSDQMDMLKGQNEVELPKETVMETVKQTVKETVNPNPEKAEEDKQPPRQKTDYVYTLIPQQPAPNKPTCSFFTSLFSSCKQPPQRCYSLNE